MGEDPWMASSLWQGRQTRRPSAVCQASALLWVLMLVTAPMHVATEKSVEEQLADAHQEIRRLQVQLSKFLGDSPTLDAEEANSQANATTTPAPGSGEQVLVVDLNTGVVGNLSANSAEVAQLLRSTTTPEPTVDVGGYAIPLKFEELCIVLGMLLFMAVLCALPQVFPFKPCCERCYHRVYPLIVVVDVAVFVYVMSRLGTVKPHDLFFTVVHILEFVIDWAETLLSSVATVFILIMAWKFKDRILATLGVDNPVYFVGDFRDWATCWSMRRFHALELLIWKVEGIPAARLTSSNDLYIEVGLGYNLNTRTRVHARAGHSCILRERMQLNFDPYDTGARMKIWVMNQEVVVPSEISSVTLSAAQVARFEEQDPGRGALATTSAEVWSEENFVTIDLIPSGTIYLRFVSKAEGGGLCGCCWPSEA